MTNRFKNITRTLTITGVAMVALLPISSLDVHPLPVKTYSICSTLPWWPGCRTS